MGKINVLSEHLSNMIAAGEVVERPSGIVKELVENSIDAHAHDIAIDIIQGGIESIVITDDGEGMDAQDATTAFERHATSKMKEENDLWNIHTMGFRGEALPSIASVSHVILQTNDGHQGTEVEIRYGKFEGAHPAACPAGTRIEVRHLFQRTPARFKHLKSPQYEFSLISDVVQKFALSYPEIRFTLTHEGKMVFQTRGNGSLREILMQMYDRSVAKSAIEIHGQDLDYSLEGMAVQPKYNRATKYFIFLFINRRMIRSYHLQKAILDAYHPYLPKDRFPIVVLNVRMDAQLVDVNVHPSKWEIRLSKERQLEKLIYETLREALKEAFEVVELESRKEKPKVEVQTLQFSYAQDAQMEQLQREINESFAPGAALAEEPAMPPVSTFAVESSPARQKERHDQLKQELYPTPEPKSEPVASPKPKQPAKREEEPVEKAPEQKPAPVQQPAPQKEPEPAHQRLPELKVIGQFHRSYILAEGEEGLYIIDQHAAQERYHYEQIRSAILSGQKDTQMLVLPLQIETSPHAVSRIDELNALLGSLGIQFEAFGEQTLLCRELPVWMKDVDEAAFLRDMIDIWQRDERIDIARLREHAIATMACHSSIRFNRTLNEEEMKRVIDDLNQCEQPFHCPHGRPTIVCMSDAQLRKEFERG